MLKCLFLFVVFSFNPFPVEILTSVPVTMKVLSALGALLVNKQIQYLLLAGYLVSFKSYGKELYLGADKEIL